MLPSFPRRPSWRTSLPLNLALTCSFRAQAERIQQKLKWLDERLSTRIAETTEDEFRNHPDYRSVTAQLERLSNDGQRRLSDLQKRCVKWGYFNTLLPGVGGLILSLYMGLGKVLFLSSSSVAITRVLIVVARPQSPSL